MRKIILASTSPYRQSLLQQLQVPFEAVAPDYVEELDSSVAPALLVRHLAIGKAQSLVELYPDALIIGSDQLFVDQRDRPVGKPGNMQGAIEQLRHMSGRTHTFYTGLAVIDSRSGEIQADYDSFSVQLRRLTDAQILSYLSREQPFNCAGSFKVEGLGIALMERMEGSDYNTLIGMPLIKLVTMLDYFKVPVLR